MKLWIFSDLHLEFGWLGLDFEVPDADICIVAGGIDRGGPRRSIEFLAENVPDLPVVFVAGNDEFRGSSVLDGLVDGGREAAVMVFLTSRNPRISIPPTGADPIRESPTHKADSQCGKRQPETVYDGFA